MPWHSQDGICPLRQRSANGDLIFGWTPCWPEVLPAPASPDLGDDLPDWPDCADWAAGGGAACEGVGAAALLGAIELGAGASAGACTGIAVPGTALVKPTSTIPSATTTAAATAARTNRVIGLPNADCIS